MYTFDEGSGQVFITLQKDSGRRSERDDIQVTVALGSPGNATEGQDYNFSQQIVSFLPSEQTKTVTLNITGDDTAERVESFTLLVVRDSALRLSNPIFPTTEVVIDDDDDDDGM